MRLVLVSSLTKLLIYYLAPDQNSKIAPYFFVAMDGLSVAALQNVYSFLLLKDFGRLEVASKSLGSLEARYRRIPCKNILRCHFQSGKIFKWEKEMHILNTVSLRNI